MLFLTIEKGKDCEHQKYTLLKKGIVWEKKRWRDEKENKKLKIKQQSKASSLAKSQKFFT